MQPAISSSFPMWRYGRPTCWPCLSRREPSTGFSAGAFFSTFRIESRYRRRSGRWRACWLPAAGRWWRAIPISAQSGLPIGYRQAGSHARTEGAAARPQRTPALAGPGGDGRPGRSGRHGSRNPYDGPPYLAVLVYVRSGSRPMLTAETRPLLRTDAARNEAEMKTETLTAGARPLIPHNRPLITDADIAAVSGTLASGWIAQGPQTRAFEEEVCAFLGLEGDAVAVSSGTTALHLALLALGVGPEDAVILPTYVCSAVLNAVCHAGAAPVLADVSPNDFNLDPAHVHALLTARTKAIIAPHTYGFPADIGALRALGVPVVEDCAQAIGAAVAGRKAGTLGDIAIFSFYATKLMTTGQGGMVVGPRTLMETVRDLRDFDCRPTYRVRYNYQMTDFQAALGRSQLAR